MSILEACIEFCENYMYEDEVFVSCQDYCSEIEDIEDVA